jgi:hypothetical protein
MYTFGEFIILLVKQFFMKMTFFRPLLTLASLTLLSNLLFAQPQWLNYQFASSVNDIKIQHDDVWISSYASLSRYSISNRTFTRFTPANSGIFAGSCHGVEFDSQENVWVNNVYGVSKFDGSSWETWAITLTGDTVGSISFIDIDDHDVCWGIGNFGFYIDSLGMHRITGFNEIDGKFFPGIQGITCLNDKVYIATQKYGVMYYDGSTWAAFDTSQSPVFSNYALDVKHDNNGVLWMIFKNKHTDDFHIYSFDGLVWNDYPMHTGFGYFTPSQIDVDKNNVKYFVGSSSVTDTTAILTFNDTIWERVYDNSGQILSRLVGCVAVDSSEKVWVGYNAILSMGKIAMNVISIWDGQQTDTIDAAPASVYNARKLMKGIDSAIYLLATENIYKFQNNGWLNISPPEILLGKEYNDAIIDNQGNLWICTGSPFSGPRGVAKFDGTSWTYHYLNQLNYPQNLNCDQAGNIWITGKFGTDLLAKFNGTFFQYFHTSLIPTVSTGLAEFAIDQSDNLWIPCDGRILKYDGTNWQSFDSTNCGINGYARVLALPSGRVIAHTNAQRYFEFDGTTFQPSIFMNLNFDQNGYYGITEDRLGKLWVGTSTGTKVFDQLGLVKEFNLFSPGMLSKGATQVLFQGTNVWFLHGGVTIYNEDGITTLEYQFQRKLEGECFFDLNANGVRDSGEVALANQKMMLSPDSIFTSTNSLGHYRFFTDSLSHQVQIIPDVYWSVTTDSLAYHCPADTLNYDSLDFGIQNDHTIHKMNISLSSGLLRCNRESPFWITIKNSGSEFEDLDLSFNFDPTYTFVGSSIIPSSTSSTNINWVLNQIPPYGIMTISILMQTPAQGQALFSVDAVLLATGVIYTDSIQGIIRCSYDPNDKECLPEGVGPEHFTLMSDTLIYTIHFQNFGTDTAFSIVVYDTLDISIVDMNSFQMIASYPTCLTTYSNSGALKFDFGDVELPNKDVNDVGSQGFIKYSILPKNGIPDPSVLLNDAHIIFDFNPAIKTNETWNTLVQSIITNAKEIELPALKVFPLPASDYIRIYFEHVSAENFLVELYSITGEKTRTFQASNSSTIDISNLSSGVYFIAVYESGKTFRRKFIKM